MRFAVCSVVVAVQSAAFASDPPAAPATTPDAEAKLAFEQGLEELRGERWPEAEADFRRSLGFVKRMSTMYDLAFVLYMRGEPRECLALLEELGRGEDGVHDARYEGYAALLMPRVLAELGSFQFVVSPPFAEVRVDGELAHASGSTRSLRVLPGNHDIVANAPGFEAKDFALVARGGVEVQRDISLVSVATEHTPSPTTVLAEAPAPRSHAFLDVAPWVVVGVGGALLASGVVTGIAALNADSDFHSHCPSNRDCDPQYEPIRSRALAFGHAADVLLVSGAVVTAGGISWRLLTPGPRRGSRSSAVVVSASGNF